MRTSVVNIFPAFSTIFEGRVPWPYLDIKGLVTTAVGDLIDSSPEDNPWTPALSLPWMDSVDGHFLSREEIIAGWKAVKAMTSHEREGGGSFAKYTRMRLSNDAIDNLLRTRATEMELILQRRISSWDDLCADAQLGVLSMSWAMGPSFNYPHFLACLANENFASYLNDDSGALVVAGGCAIECFIPDATNPGLVPRNAVNRQLFEAAQRVKDGGLDPDVLHYKDAA